MVVRKYFSTDLQLIWSAELVREMAVDGVKVVDSEIGTVELVGEFVFEN